MRAEIVFPSVDKKHASNNNALRKKKKRKSIAREWRQPKEFRNFREDFDFGKSSRKTTGGGPKADSSNCFPFLAVTAEGIWSVFYVCIRSIVQRKNRGVSCFHPDRTLQLRQSSEIFDLLNSEVFSPWKSTKTLEREPILLQKFTDNFSARNHSAPCTLECHGAKKGEYYVNMGTVFDVASCNEEQVSQNFTILRFCGVNSVLSEKNPKNGAWLDCHLGHKAYLLIFRLFFQKYIRVFGLANHIPSALPHNFLILVFEKLKNA